jgi:hypothetical protein
MKAMTALAAITIAALGASCLLAQVAATRPADNSGQVLHDRWNVYTDPRRTTAGPRPRSSSSP